MDEQELRQYIKQNWNGRDFLKISSNKEMRSVIENQTSFLDAHYSNLLLKQRAYFIVNDINEEQIPLCSCGCGKLVELNRDATKGFRKFYSEECHRSADKIPKEALEKLSDKQWLYNERVVLKKAIETIGEELGISHVPVDKWLKKHGIKDLKISRIRNLDAYYIIDDKEKLIELYQSGLTCEQIAEPLKVTRGLIARTLKSYGVDLRPSNSYDRKVNRVSGEEQELIDFISSVYFGEMRTSNRSVLNGRELDIYLPELNLAIEYNGLYSHSYKPWEEKECLVKGPNYHLQKTLDCEKQGIRLIHIFSDEWKYKKDIVKSIFKSKLGLNKKIYADNCKVIKINTDRDEFLNNNHINNEFYETKIKFGLEYKNKLIYMMTFERSLYDKKYEWILINYCNLKYIDVVGGFNKLLTHFRTVFPGSIISYSDRRWGNENDYLKNGFILDKIIEPSCYYLDKSYRVRRSNYKFMEYNNREYNYINYSKIGLNKIYDCGSSCFILD